MKMTKKAGLERCSSKQYCCRLPLSLAARFEALSEMHPQQTRSRLMADLLGLGLAQVASAAQAASTSNISYLPGAHQAVYLLSGPFTGFHGLIFKHHSALERGLVKEDADVMNPVDVYALEDVSS